MVDKNEPAFNVQKLYLFFFLMDVTDLHCRLQMLPYFGKPFVQRGTGRVQ